jgi:hypothetical protein
MNLKKLSLIFFFWTLFYSPALGQSALLGSSKSFMKSAFCKVYKCKFTGKEDLQVQGVKESTGYSYSLPGYKNLTIFVVRDLSNLIERITVYWSPAPVLTRRDFSFLNDLLFSAFYQPVDYSAYEKCGKGGLIETYSRPSITIDSPYVSGTVYCTRTGRTDQKDADRYPHVAVVILRRF